MQTLYKFQPSVSADSSRRTSAPPIKSIVELIIMKEEYDRKPNEDSNLKLILSKVAEESCKWVNNMQYCTIVVDVNYYIIM